MAVDFPRILGLLTTRSQDTTPVSILEVLHLMRPTTPPLTRLRLSVPLARALRMTLPYAQAPQTLSPGTTQSPFPTTSFPSPNPIWPVLTAETASQLIYNPAHFCSTTLPPASPKPLAFRALRPITLPVQETHHSPRQTTLLSTTYIFATDAPGHFPSCMSSRKCAENPVKVSS